MEESHKLRGYKSVMHAVLEIKEFAVVHIFSTLPNRDLFFALIMSFFGVCFYTGRPTNDRYLFSASHCKC